MTAKEFKIQVLPVSNKLLRFAIQFLKDEDQAKDVVQDIFVKLWQKRNDLNKVENIEAFAMRMVRNRCLDVIRSNRSVNIEEDAKVRLLKDDQLDPIDQMELSESARMVRDVIKSLPELQQRVMWMRDIEQLDYDEIMEVTGLKINAVRVNLSRARKKVRDELLKYQSYEVNRNKSFTAKIL